MEGRVMRTPNQRHHDPGIYDTLCSPLSFCQAGRRDQLAKSQKESIENGAALNGFSETSPELTLPKIHFAKWYDSKLDTVCGGSGGSQRSSSLSPRSMQPTLKMAYRPPTPHSQTSTPTPTHRGILKGHRPPSDATAGRGFWDNVDFRSEVNSSCNSINSSNLAESLSRKTVRFADGKPTISNTIAQAPCDSIRSTATCNIGQISQGIYEWESEGGLIIPSKVTGGLNKPPRPPKTRLTQRNERRVAPECMGPSLGLRYLPGVGVASSAGLTSLPAHEGAVAKAVDDSYANYDSIYRNESRLFSNSVDVERTDSRRVHTFADSECPYLMSSSPPPPPSISSGGPLHRTEVNISDFSQASTQSASISPPLASTSSPPIHFFTTFKPLPNRRSDCSNVEKTLEITEPTAIDDVSLRLHPLPTQNNSRQHIQLQKQMPAQTQQRKRFLQLRVDVSQPPILNSPLFLNGNSLSPLNAPLFTDSPRRRTKGLAEPPQALGVTDLKTGSLDRDGVWRPTRLPLSNGGCNVVDSSPPVSQSFGYSPSSPLTDLMGDSLLPERRHFRYAPHLFAASGNDLGTNGGGFEVPIFVMSPSTTPTPSAASISVSPAFHRQALPSKRIGIQSATVPVKRI